MIATRVNGLTICDLAPLLEQECIEVRLDTELEGYRSIIKIADPKSYVSCLFDFAESDEDTTTCFVFKYVPITDISNEPYQLVIYLDYDVYKLVMKMLEGKDLSQARTSANSALEDEIARAVIELIEGVQED